MTHLEEAVATCKYAQSLGETALKEHFDIWLEFEDPDTTEDELLYIEALIEVKSKLGTEECLLSK